MKAWLRRTHGPFIELLRHFLRRFFDSDMTVTPGQMTGVLIAALPMLFQWFLIFVGPLRQKYAHFDRLPDPTPYIEAVRADELFFIALMMSVVGLLTVVKWQSLFPDRRDFLALGALPLRPFHIFAAKLAALLLVATAALIVVNFLRAVGFPALSASRWAFRTSPGSRILAHTAATGAACLFLLFALIAIQGVLLNLLPVRAFARVSCHVQGFLIAAMLSSVVLSFSIGPDTVHAALRPEWSPWLPPVWFLAIYQTLSGDPDPAMRLLACRAPSALLVAVSLTLFTYFLSYRRCRALLMEAPASAVGTTDRRRNVSALSLFFNQRHLAVIVFMMGTLSRSSYHRMILTAYAGFAFALLLTGLSNMANVATPNQLILADFVYYHLLAIIFLLSAARHLFSRPVELGANWIFQLTEGEGRPDWMRAMGRFLLFWGFVLMLLIPLPVEWRLMGARGILEAALLSAIGMLAYEWAFSSWDKLPFTCSHLPGGTPTWMVLGLLGLLSLLALLHQLLIAVVADDAMFVVALAGILLVRTRLRRLRLQA